MTAEAKVGIFVKQARIAASVLGDAAYHKRRFSALGGYG
jgi:hypothetical protein